ncbi:VCBS repeat-containing protein, partial [Cyanobium sp. Morenito 9A2]|uniref:beta strand repeat-containing protein n=1 Tax=Cyanobium sp. Morenito 9A2 TaxID=2823718 RepID=UPI0020CEA6E1
MLLEELGHAIDTRLNGRADSPGDEGERFSALLLGQQPSTASLSENDQRLITVAGTAVAVEAAGDTSAPRGALKFAPRFSTASVNPFGLTDVGTYSTPTLVDIDSDGDLDAFIGNFSGNTLFFRNNAPLGATIPAFSSASSNPFGLLDVGFGSRPTFADIDVDGDLDAFIGDNSGNIAFFRNTAALGASSPIFSAAIINPFGLSDVGDDAFPAFADIDNDGDLDIFIGNGLGNTLFFRNTAIAGATVPIFSSVSSNPFGLVDVGSAARVSFFDSDADGDLDAFIGNLDGNTFFFLNTATVGASAPAFSAAVTNPFGLADVGDSASPNVVDFDADGDLDAFIGEGFGNTIFLRNTAPLPVALVGAVNPSGSYGLGAVIHLTVAFDEAVLVSGVPQLQLETGSVDRFATYSSGSGTTTLTFTYTVQAGDTSADLDQLSAAALSLNGGAIKDAAGNHAILALAAPGSPGSLAAQKALVIDASAPRGAFVFDPVFSEASLKPFGLASVGGVANPSLVDIDRDGDLDMFIGNLNGNTIFFRNTASLGTSAPAFTTPVLNPFGLVDVGSFASPSFVDVDRDGDLDALIGNEPGNTLFFRNIAAAGASAPVFSAVETNPFALVSVGYVANPSFVDIDGDGDLDAFIGNYYGNTLFFRNTAAPGSSTLAFSIPSTIPFGLTNAGAYVSPRLIDVDGDGDLDAFIGNSDGNVLFFRNTATLGSSSPAFSAATTNPFGLTAVAGGYANPCLVDVDGDGDLDIYIGDSLGNSTFFRNIAPAPVAAVTSTTIDGSYGIGSIIELTVAFNEAVLVTGVPQLQLETGMTDRFAAFIAGSGTKTLSFAYTVQAGDSSADLDQLSADALTLNGGTIKDGFGNSALLTLTAPGSTGSLGANRALVIDTTAPTVTGVSSSNANGSYGIGALIDVTVTFSEAVLVTRVPRLQLETGLTDRVA